MAIHFKEILRQLTDSPLDESELQCVDEAEKFIDNIIVERFDGKTLYIDDTDLNRFFKKIKSDIRTGIAIGELIKRFKRAGWELKEECDSIDECFYNLNGIK